MPRRMRFAEPMALRFDFKWDDRGLGELLTDGVDLPCRPVVGDAVLVTIDGGRGPVVTRVYITEITWNGIPSVDKAEPVGTLTLHGSKP